MRDNNTDAREGASTPQFRSEIVFERPGALEITPGIATVMLRILRNDARRQQLDIDDNDPSDPLAFRAS